MFDQLSSIDASRTSWRIKVRVTRIWPSVSNSSNSSTRKDSVKGYNLILLDDEDCHVHAFVYADNWKSMKEKMVEGGIYIVSNFYAKEATGSLKPVSSNFLINFSNSTTVEKVKDDDFMIPMQKFEFVDLSDLFSLANGYQNPDSPDHSTDVDVIGVIEDYKNLSKIQTRYGERDIVKFRLTDGRHSHKVTIWGSLAETTEESYRGIMDRPIIVILSSTKLKTFHSSVQISTLPSSKVYLNLENDVVTDMRQRLDEEGYVASEKVLSSPTQTETSFDVVLETLTLKELSEKTSTKYLRRSFLCKVKIKNVEENDNWWYYCCNKNKCFEEVSKLEGKYRCFKCNRNYPIAQKRYKIVVLAEDQTEAYNFVLYDRAAKRMLGKTSTKMIADGINSTKEYSAEIKDLTGKEVTLKIELHDDNILLKSTVYYATDSYDCSIATNSICDATLSGYTISDSADNSVLDLSSPGNTPGSAKSTSKKIKVEN